MKNFLHILICFAIFLVSSASANGQKLSDSELQTFLAKATEKTAEYSTVFKNLSAEETKTFETFDKTGKLKSQKKVLSDLIIYESATNNGNLGEFRNVREVDGKKIKDGDKRTIKVFANLADAKSFEEELEKLNKESSRYDEGISIHGFTLNQAIPVSSSFIESFKFEEIGRENVAGSDAIVVKFQQTTVNPNIEINFNAPDFLEISNKFYRGIVWLDLKNYRVLKLIIELTFDSSKFTEPFIVMKQQHFYQPGKFEIYLPQKIVVENFNPQTDKSAKLLLKTGKIKPGSQLQTRLTMEYKNFSKFDVTVKSAN